MVFYHNDVVIMEQSGGNHPNQQKANGATNLHCKICDKKFTRVNNLRRHERSHQERFPCSKCAQTFNRKDAAKRHERTAHSRPELQIKCSKCDATFRDVQQLQNHHRTIHRKRDSKTNQDSGK